MKSCTLPTRGTLTVMEGGSAVRDELSLAAELVERELEALRAVDGVTSATAKDRTNLRKPLNTMMAKVRLQGRSNALTVHCGLAVPDLLSAVQKVSADLATIVGEAAMCADVSRGDLSLLF